MKLLQLTSFVSKIGKIQVSISTVDELDRPDRAVKKNNNKNVQKYTHLMKIGFYSLFYIYNNKHKLQS